jgi:hypothetical protein
VLRTNRIFPPDRSSRRASVSMVSAMSTATTSSTCAASALDSRPTPQPKSSARPPPARRPSARASASAASTSRRPVPRNSSRSHFPPRVPGATYTAHSGSSAPSRVQSCLTPSSDTGTAYGSRVRRPPWDVAWSALLTLVVLAPVLRPGYVLSYDMVATPRQDLLPAAVGLGSAPPRAVPVDAVVALLTTVVDGQLVQKAALLATLFLAGLGAGRLLPAAPGWVRAAAAGLYLWNPYVAERLVLGSWVLLVGYAALPWVLAGALRVRAGDRGWPRLLVPLTVGALAPTGGLLTALVAVAAVGPGARRRLVAAGAAVVANAPWWVPSLLRPGSGVSDDAGVTAFAARAESWAGTLGSLLGLGGVWNADVVPASRTAVTAPLLTLAVLVLAGYGLRPLAAAWGRPVLAPVLALAAAGLLLAAGGSWTPTADLLAAAVRTVPGAGLLRDTQKWVALLALPLAPAAALGLARLGRLPVRAVAAVALALPLVALPDLAWGAFGRLQPVHYPADWGRVRALLRDDPRPGDVVALPYAAFRAFDWNGGRTALDPAPRYLPRTVVTDDRLRVGGTTVAGDDPRATAVAGALGDPAALRRAGVGWVLVEKDTPGPPLPDLSRAEPVYSGDSLALYRLPGPVTEPAGPDPVPVVLADAAALLLLTGSGIMVWRRPRSSLPAGKVPIRPDGGASACRPS